MYNRSVHCIRSVCVCVGVCVYVWAKQCSESYVAEGRVIALCEREDPLFVGLWRWVGEQVVLCNPYPWVHRKRKRVHSSYPLPYMVKRNLNHIYSYLCTYVRPCGAGLIPSIIVYVVYVWRINSCYNVLLVLCCLSIVIMGPSDLLHQLI